MLPTINKLHSSLSFEDFQKLPKITIQRFADLALKIYSKYLIVAGPCYQATAFITALIMQATNGDIVYQEASLNDYLKTARTLFKQGLAAISILVTEVNKMTNLYETEQCLVFGIIDHLLKMPEAKKASINFAQSILASSYTQLIYNTVEMEKYENEHTNNGTADKDQQSDK